MPPNGDNDVILFDRGTGEETKMCKKDDTANSPATGGVLTDLPVSTMSTPLNPGTQMDDNAINFLNALTGQTGVSYKTIDFSADQSFDEQLRPQLRANAKNIAVKNRDWWDKLGLNNFYPLGDLDPYEVPNTYANLTFSLQQFFNNNGLAKKVLKRGIDEDGIFGREAMLILFQLAENYPSNETELKKIPKLLALVRTLFENVQHHRRSPDFAQLVVDLEKHLLTVAIKPETIVKWNYENDIYSLIALLRYNSKRRGPIQSGFHFDSDFYPIIRSLCQNDQEAQHITDVLTLEQKFDMLKALYEGKTFNVSAVYFEVKREFTHAEDLNEVNPNKDYRYFSLNFLLNNGQYVDEIEHILKIKFPNWGLVNKTRERSRHYGESTEEDKDKTKDKVKEPLLISLAIFHYMPKIEPKQQAAAKALIDSYVMETDSINQESLNFLKRVQEDVERRKTLPADITDYQVMMDVLTYSVASRGDPTAGTMVLMEKAETTFFLTVKLDPKGESFILPYRQIIEANEKAVYNDSYHMKIGEFKPPNNSPLHLDSANLKAVRDDDEFIHVYLGGHYQPWPERKFKSMEPVCIDVGVLDPEVGTLTEFWRDTFGERVWQVTSHWMLSDSLPDMIPKIRESLDNGLWWKGLDLVITTATLAASFAGAFLASSGLKFLGMGSKLVIPLTRGIVKALFWFVLTEYLAAKFIEFDKKINSDKDNYSDDDRAIWNTFKIGLFIFGGAMILRQAWKGLKFAGSKLFASSLTELELELLAKATTKPLPFSGAITRMLSAKTAALTASKQWAKEALALTASTLRDLTEETVARLKQLPPWALNFIKEMTDEVIRRLFGCASFCKVDLTAIKNQLISVVVDKLKLDKIKGILAFEREMLKNLSFEAWDRIIKYAIKNSNYFSVKGKIAEELFLMKAEFRKVYDAAIKAAEAKGILPADMKFVNVAKGWVPFQKPRVYINAAGQEKLIYGFWGELTDGMFVGIKRHASDPAKDELHILAVFESKSPSNMDALAKGKYEYVGQMGKDFERMSESKMKIMFGEEEKFFAPDAVIVSRNTTQWVGILPPGYKLTDDVLKRLKAALPDVLFMEGPVRNEALNEVAKALKELIIYQPKKVKPTP